MIKIAICDNDAYYTTKTKEAILNARASQGKEIKISVFSDIEDIVKTVEKREFDIIFMNVQLENTAFRIKDAYRIKCVYPESLIVYITAYHGRFAEVVRREWFGILHKPLCVEQLENVLLDTYARLGHNSVEYEIEYKGLRSSIRIKDIICVTAEKKKCKLITKYKEYTVHKNLHALEREFSYVYPYFLQPNRKCLVNYFQIRHIIKGNIIILYNGMDIAISTKFKEEFYKKYDNIF